MRTVVFSLYFFSLFLCTIVISSATLLQSVSRGPETLVYMASYDEEGLYLDLGDLGSLQVCVRQYADRTTDVGTYVSACVLCVRAENSAQ